MLDFLESSASWGSVLTILSFGAFSALQRKVRAGWLNPLLLSAVLIGAILVAAKIPYALYKESTQFVSWLLLPATVSLAIPLYEQWEVFRKNAAGVLAGVAAGVLTSIVCAAAIAGIFHLEKSYAVTILPKSVTTAIGVDISTELGGIPALTTVLIVLTGITGNLLAQGLCRLFRLKNPIARGIAIGTCSHAIGTAKALEMGEVEGAMSGLAVALAGILTAVLAPLAVRFL